MDARRLRGFDGQDDVLLVKHLVVLKVMQQRRGHEARIAGEEYRGALDEMRRAFLQALDEILERHLGPSRLAGEDGGTAPPGPDHDGHDGPEQQRDPGAFQ